MTLEAWVRPTRGRVWRTVMFKEQPGQLVYALYAERGRGPAERPRIHRRGSGRARWGCVGAAERVDAPGGGVRRWRRCGCTSNGTLASTLAIRERCRRRRAVADRRQRRVAGMVRGAGSTRCACTTARSRATEIQSDMGRRVGVPDTAAPTAPGSLDAHGPAAARSRLAGRGRPTTSACSTTTCTAARGRVHAEGAANRVAADRSHVAHQRAAPGTYHTSSPRNAAGNAGAVARGDPGHADPRRRPSRWRSSRPRGRRGPGQCARPARPDVNVTTPVAAVQVDGADGDSGSTSARRTAPGPSRRA